MSYVDVHCHLDEATYGDLPALISRCAMGGVDKIITVGVDLPSSRLCKRLAEAYPQVYFAAGFHPTELKDYKESDLDKIAGLCAHPKCVALGEIGLDYHYDDTDEDKQKRAFLSQLELASTLGLPVQIHSRDCAEDTLNILKANKCLLNGGLLLHCYSYSPELAREFLKLGAYFSFGGASTRKSSKKAKRTIAELPEERILTETDSPYMPPAGEEGTFPNTPCAIPKICACIADIRGVTAEYMREKVGRNACELFKKLG